MTPSDRISIDDRRIAFRLSVLPDVGNVMEFATRNCLRLISYSHFQSVTVSYVRRLPKIAAIESFVGRFGCFVEGRCADSVESLRLVGNYVVNQTTFNIK